MSEPSANWFSIPAHRPFLDDLAAGLIDSLPGPEDTPGALLLVPTRRAARALGESFLKAAGGRAVLLPQIRALGDLDEGEPPFEPGDAGLDLPPAIDAMRRRFELAAMVDGLSKGKLGTLHALDLADALAEFMDAAAIEEAPVSERIGELVAMDQARHWEVSAAVLSVAVEAWPERLKALGLMDVAERRVRLLDHLTKSWTDRPPQGPVIAAGSTGAQPATARLLEVVAGLPRGAVILPGLDQDLADRAWAEIEDQHPQAAMKRLLELARVPRATVRPWRTEVTPGEMKGRWRRRVINEALRPAEATADWLDVIADLRAEGAAAGVDPFEVGLEGLSAVTGAHEEETASLCALLLRETLETPGKTCALITPDQTLARRVSARLARWGVTADSTAGVSLALKPAGALAITLAELVLDPADPVARLSLLKSPLARLGRAPEALAAAAELLEARALRGPRPLGPEAVIARLAKRARPEEAEALAAARALSEALDEVIALATDPFADGEADPASAAAGLAAALERLGEGGELWAGPEGEALSRLLAGLIAEGRRLVPVNPLGFRTLIHRMVSAESVRGGEATHPRLLIMGTLESRMTRADRLVLAGLEEGVWPRGAPIDPFLSRAMRKTLGLPSPERRIGLSAHDFAQAACAPEVVLVSSARREGAPATESRWLWRLRTLAKGAGKALPGRPDLLDWARSLDVGHGDRWIGRPEPKPPVEDRPTRLAVTRLETLTRDPYAVWARDILKLFPMERPDQLVENTARGTAIHTAFEALARQWNTAQPADPVAVFEARYIAELQALGLSEAALTRERVLARETAAWVADFERRRRAGGARVHVEASGEMSLNAGGVPHTLTAKADRIEIAPDGTGHILDYKTGAAPTAKMIDTGFSPQLTLTAAILAAGGFDNFKGGFGDLAYVRITGRDPAGELVVRKTAGDESKEAADAAVEGAMRLLAAYQNPDQPYASRTAPQFVKTYAGDYDHLARVMEWSTGADGEEGE
ncbi:double-strand break repair protein AddB [Caulobacter sp. SLTY]|uniref:double-strand break repair protein AddB n=1 Tax=Caulobacter sp. SLTY TaxID=2683262 RepID=UPI001411D27A|nr:double-strand break repair protein AddB [Caulobacter sp. SLTY]NBB13989.1 double-strand break repair protein AddB [Caulobacter sp. SLTY]